jgi:hypothetical protein
MVSSFLCHVNMWRMKETYPLHKFEQMFEARIKLFLQDDETGAAQKS